ncbi:MAG: hypothetical protein IKY78_01430 [Clostridia bacterium]|nr:hypothetical protein [Clostridia bacterium]
MKTFNRILSLLMVVLMLIASAYTVVAVNTDAENYTLTLESNSADAFTTENSTEGKVALFGRVVFDGCYGNQLDGVAKELYDSMVSYYATGKKTGEYSHTFKKAYTFKAEVSGGKIVMNDELEEISVEIDYAMQAAMDAFLYDHPEVFWLRKVNSSYKVSGSGNSADGYVGKISGITITPTEIYSGASAKISKYNTAVEAAVKAITSTGSRYDILKSIHDYICKNAWYNLTSEHKVHTSEPFFLGDKGIVCEGYSKSFKVLCDKLGIPCVLVSGYAGESHMWNYVKMEDGRWYLIDTTWDDQKSKLYDTYFLANANTVGFDGLAVSEERTERTDFSGTGIFRFTYPALSAKAYQKSAGGVTVTLSATKFIYDGKNKTPKVTVKDANGKVLTKNVDYKITVASKRSSIGRYTVKVTLMGKYEGTKNVYFYVLPGKTASVKSASQTTSAIKLSWSAVPGATGYTVYRYSPAKKAYVKVGATEGTSLTVKSLYAGTKYTFRVVAYGKTSAGKVYDSDSYTLLRTATKTKTPELTKVTASSTKGKAYVYHSDVSGETGYTVYYSTSKDSGFKKYANFKADTTRCDITGLTSGKTYYFKVRTYITTESGYVYSAWSTVKSVKVK